MTPADIAIIVVCCAIVLAVTVTAIVRRKKGRTSCGCGDCASCTACRGGHVTEPQSTPCAEEKNATAEEEKRAAIERLLSQSTCHGCPESRSRKEHNCRCESAKTTVNKVENK